MTGVHVGIKVVSLNSSSMSVNSYVKTNCVLLDKVYILGRLGSIQSSSSASNREKYCICICNLLMMGYTVLEQSQ